MLSNAYQQAQLQIGIFSPETISVGELFAGALLPGFALVGLYMLYLALLAFIKPSTMPAIERVEGEDVSLINLLSLLAGPLLLIVAVLGSILMGLATPTEAAAVGATGAMLLALKQKQLSIPTLRDVVYQSARVSAMVFMILVGASLFSLFQIMTLESWSMGIARPVMEVHPWAWMFFVPFVVVTSFTVLNLFIALIVNSMQAVQADEQQRSERVEGLAHDEREAIIEMMEELRQEIRELKNPTDRPRLML